MAHPKRDGPGRGRRPPPQGEPEKRRAILHAALRVFADKGYHGCRIADVARQAGVAYGLVYHYFRNKDELLESVLAEQWAILIGAIRAIADGPGSAADQVAAVIRYTMDVFRTAPAAVRVLILEVPRTPGVIRAGTDRETFETAMGLVAEMVRRGQAAGELRRDVDPRVCAASVLGVLDMNLTGMVTGTLSAPTPSEAELERMKREVVAVALQGILAQPGRTDARAAAVD
ncbi:MAG TPA: TetR/AcrR family transcriptional regulator [Anaeromyxobacteraceae bacterium]|nr:TetR/AcrR family transcriptional regulator [Anaeromyxobacteraceae bacterium]